MCIGLDLQVSTCSCRLEIAVHNAPTPPLVLGNLVITKSRLIIAVVIFIVPVSILNACL
ncbi:hypothetical protein D3C84_1194660 [compost metagenome]